MKKNLNQGYIALISVLIISAVTLAIVVSISLLGVDELKSSLTYKKGNEAFAAASACLDEALYRLSQNSSYAGGSLPVPDVQCSIIISGSDPDFIVETSGQDIGTNYTRRIRTTVKKLGTSVKIVNYEEVP
jgi:hypothetical protein